MKLSFTFLLTVFFIPLVFGQNISAVVHDKATNTPIDKVSVFTADGVGTETDARGRFSLTLPAPEVILHFRHIGYAELALPAKDLPERIYLIPAELELPEVTISTMRVVPGVTPVSYSTLTAREIANHYTVEDAPMVLSAEPGVYAYSESGNGTGYSYLSIRGFDQSRIGVMVDNVPLNDNESHQVYWVDHGDVLSDATDVEIQRGVGNSLYGATAFGGSVNVQTAIRSADEAYRISALTGSYNTLKYRLSYQSGQRLGKSFSLRFRTSGISSNGYRVDSRSKQYSFFLGAEYNRPGQTHQFRMNLGKEVSRLQWDGVSGDMIHDRSLRTGKMPWTEPFTDDFFQQIYSLNSALTLSDHLLLKNTAYLVTGSGFYKVRKYGRDYYSYNLDILNEYPDSVEIVMETDLLRRKWIQNHYFGLVPTLTFTSGNLRNDTGIELRQYRGAHFGEVLNVSDPILAANLPAVYRYYDYTGTKSSVTAFTHFVYSLGGLHLTADLQLQRHHWKLDQQKLGHFPGYQLQADWNFVNPRFGALYALSPEISIFSQYGIARLEPSDNQILNGDDVWDQPRAAHPEKITDLEIGFSHHEAYRSLKVNYYRIDYSHELLSDIYDFEETEFQVRTADKTVHSGLEFETSWRLTPALTVTLNGALADNTYASGILKDKKLMNTPDQLFNVSMDYAPGQNAGLSLLVKYTGRQYIDDQNSREISIEPFAVTNVKLWAAIKNMRIDVSVNNLFDKLYATYGYNYYGGYYWPGATRNIYLELHYTF